MCVTVKEVSSHKNAYKDREIPRGGLQGGFLFLYNKAVCEKQTGEMPHAFSNAAQR